MIEKWWKDEGSDLYYSTREFPFIETIPRTMLFKPHWPPGWVYWDKEYLDEEIRSYFPLVGRRWIKDMDTMRRYINFPVNRIVFINNARCLYNDSPYNGHFDQYQINWLRKAMQTYAEVADDPIYQEVLDKYHWNKEEKGVIKDRKEEMQIADEARQRNLLRFLHAQDGGGIYDNTSTYETALQEIRDGHKRTHWIWYVFPQMKALAHSEIAKFYGIDGREEATMYINHPILKKRLIEAFQAVLDSKISVYDIFGEDAIKVRNCALLFNSIKRIPVIEDVITKYRW